MAEERRKEPIEYVREEADEATDRQLESDASKEAVEEEEKTGGALPRRICSSLDEDARVNEISAASPEGFEEAIQEGIERANKTLHNVQSAWVKDMNVFVEDGQITVYKVNLAITFVLKETV